MTELPTLLPRVEDLATLPTSQLSQIKTLLEKYFSSTGTNVVLHNILRNSIAVDFAENAEKTIIKQVLNVALVDKIARHTGTMKSEEIPLFEDWDDFEDAVDGGRDKIFLLLLFAGAMGGMAAVESLGGDEAFSLKNKTVIRELNKRVDFLTEILDKTTKDWILGTISSGRERGMNATLIARTIRERIERVARARASMIVETEAVNAMNLVEMEVYQRSGIEYVEWMTTPTERTCNVCIGNEYAGKVKAGEEFPSGHAYPPAHSHCRCLLLPVLPDGFDGEIWTGK